MRHDSLEPVFVELMPERFEHGKLYISLRFELAIHLCACGCTWETVTPLDAHGWQLIQEGDLVSLRPSIANNQAECRSHYFVTSNRVNWC